MGKGARNRAVRARHLHHRDPPRVPQVRVKPMFDTSPHRNRGMEGIPHELFYPNDNLLVSTMCFLGMPQFVAEQCRHSPQVRFLHVKTWLDYHDAIEGDSEARERIDYIMSSFADMRQQQWIADHPQHSMGI